MTDTEVTETDRVWLRHEGIADAFHCPIAAAGAWKDRGWIEAEAPPEVNKALPDRVPDTAPAAAAGETPAASQDKPETKKTSRTSAAADSTEGVNS